MADDEAATPPGGTIGPTPGHWSAVGLMLAGFAVCTFAFVLEVIWLGILGAVIGAAGIITAKFCHLLESSH